MKEKDILLKYGIAPSMQRIEILNFLENNRIHPSIDEIYRALSPKMPTLSKMTVYNTLQRFADKGLVWEIRVSENEARYDINTKFHAHFRCVHCNRIHDIEEHGFTEPEKFLEGHLVNNCQVNFTGVCKNCMKKDVKH